jgi:hypothetical protein
MAKAEDKYIEPVKVDFSIKIVGEFKAFGKKHPIPDVRLSEAYSYYGRTYSWDEGMKWLIEYMENNQFSSNDIDKAKRANPTMFSMATCTQAKLLNDNCKLPDDSKAKLKTSIINGLAKSVVVLSESANTNPKPSVQDYIRKQAGQYIAEIEGILDDKKYGFSCYDYLSDKQVSAAATSYITKKLASHYNEVFQAYNKMDEQLTEGYSHFTEKDLLAYSIFLKKLVEDCDRWASNKKAVRKPRKAKERPVSAQTAKLKYQREYSELKILSINPEAIVGSHQLWLYNTKDRKLAVYNSTKLGGLTIKGTTLQGFSEELSEIKKIRKPQIMLPKLLDGGKVVLKHFMEEIKAKPQKATGRINGFTILLRAIK